MLLEFPFLSVTDAEDLTTACSDSSSYEQQHVQHTEWHLVHPPSNDVDSWYQHDAQATPNLTDRRRRRGISGAIYRMNLYLGRSPRSAH